MYRGQSDAFLAYTSQRGQGDAFDVQVLGDRETGSPHARFFAAVVKPDSGMKRHVHRVDQVYLVLDGTFHIEIGEQTLEARPKSLVFLPAGLVHRNWNEGPDPVTQITMLLPQPPDGEKISFPVDILV